MPITPHQLEQRKKHLGSSDHAPMLGISPWTTAYDLWLEKTDQIEPKAQTQAMKRGNRAERYVLEFAEEELGKLLPNQYRSAKDSGVPIACNIDSILVEPSEHGIEVYGASKGNPTEGKSISRASGYGEGIEEVPDVARVQAHGHMIVTDQEVCFVPVIGSHWSERMYVVRRDNRLVDIICRVATAFWSDCVLSRRAPTAEFYRKLGLRGVDPMACCPSPDIAKVMYREPNKIVSIPHDIVTTYLQCKQAKAEAEKAMKLTEQEIFRCLGDAEAGVTEAGQAIIYFQQTRHMPAKEAYDQVFRVLRFRAKGLETE
ncbi:MAG TPA: YqaJ viral recombinase family protein [Planctomycetota bacterium]|nr:YqaJ viral recombinase family protein [Planctomycetota bacterium]